MQGVALLSEAPSIALSPTAAPSARTHHTGWGAQVPSQQPAAPTAGSTARICFRAREVPRCRRAAAQPGQRERGASLPSAAERGLRRPGGRLRAAAHCGQRLPATGPVVTVGAGLSHAESQN